MTKEDVLNNIYATQDAIAMCLMNEGEQRIAMQMLVGCAQMVAKIDTPEVSVESITKPEAGKYVCQHCGRILKYPVAHRCDTGYRKRKMNFKKIR